VESFVRPSNFVIRNKGGDGRSVLIVGSVIVDAEDNIGEPAKDALTGPVPIAAELELHENDTGVSAPAQCGPLSGVNLTQK
jgi:hypothetical protein